MRGETSSDNIDVVGKSLVLVTGTTHDSDQPKYYCLGRKCQLYFGIVSLVTVVVSGEKIHKLPIPRFYL